MAKNLIRIEGRQASRQLLAIGIDPTGGRNKTRIKEKISQESAFSNVAAKWLNHWEPGKSPRYLLHEQAYPHDQSELQLAHTQRSAVSAAYSPAQYLKPRAKIDSGLG